MKLHRKLIGVCLAALATQFSLTGTALAQMDDGPPVEKKFGVGLPRDHATTLFTDAQYPVYPLKAHQKAYADISGARMKQDIIALSKVALKYRDTVNSQWWGRFPGTSADFEGVDYMDPPSLLPEPKFVLDASSSGSDGQRIVSPPRLPDCKTMRPFSITKVSAPSETRKCSLSIL